MDVFVEKPAGITTYQTETLLRKSREMNRILHVGFNRRYIPLIQHVLKIIKETTKITQVEGCFVKHRDAACEADIIIFNGTGTFSMASVGPGKQR